MTAAPNTTAPVASLASWLNDMSLSRSNPRPKDGNMRRLWGDGFADDLWQAMVQVHDVDLCDDDELTLFYPGLRRRPAHLRRRCLAILEHTRFGGVKADRRPPAGERGAREAGTSVAFEGGPLPQKASQPFRWPEAEDDMPAEQALEAFAFETSLHPAYVWRGAEFRHEHLTVYAWLGHLGRGRPALMPAAVAATLRTTPEFAALSAPFGPALAAQGISHDDLQRAALRRLDGEQVVVRPRPGRSAVSRLWRGRQALLAPVRRWQGARGSTSDRTGGTLPG